MRSLMRRIRIFRIDLRTGAIIASSGLLMFVLIYTISTVFVKSYPLVDPVTIGVWYIISYIVMFIGMLVALPEIIGRLISRIGKAALPHEETQVLGGEEKICPKCQRNNVARARFCVKCGAKLD